jgi:hypothetical protein
VTVDQVVVDPAYNAVSLDGDVAVLHLSAPSTHEPVALGGPGDPAVGTVPTVFGWGVVDSITQLISDDLLRTAAPILDPSRCSTLETGYDAKSKLCAGGTVGQDSCNGDSGGPLVASAGNQLAALVGTVDYGSSVCGDGQPGVYQRLTSGPVASFLASTVPTAHIWLPNGRPPINGVGTVVATAGTLTGATYAWDLDQDGQYDDATGATATFPGSSSRSVAVRATGAGGDVVAQRVTVPARPDVTVTGPPEIREGDPVRLRVTPIPGAIGSITTGMSGRGVVAGYYESWFAVSGPMVYDLPPIHDDVWQGGPWTLSVAVSTTGLTLTTPKTLTIRVIDDDLPKLTLFKPTRHGKRAMRVPMTTPGMGTVTVSALRGKHVLVRKRINTAGPAVETAAVLRFSRSAVRRLRGAKPVLKATWRSSRIAGAKASATARGIRLAP